MKFVDKRGSNATPPNHQDPGDTSLVVNLGTALLIAIVMEPYCRSRSEINSKTSINSAVSGKDIGIEIVELITRKIPRNLYPDWLFTRNINDLVSLSLCMDDLDFFIDILSSVSLLDPRGLTFSTGNVINLINFLKRINEKKSKPGAPTLSQFEKDLLISKSAIIVGVLSAGRKKIHNINNLEDVQEEAASMLGYSVGTIKKHVYEKDHNEFGVIVRSHVENIMTPLFDKLNEDKTIPVPTRMECYMVAFLALWNDFNIWTGEKTEKGIPMLNRVD